MLAVGRPPFGPLDRPLSVDPSMTCLTRG
jgi:hypothetical protein